MPFTLIQGIQLTALAGLLLSIYAYYIEKRAERQKDYKAVCDIKESMSCTAAFTSPYGKIAGISNSLVGIIFYAFFIFMTSFSQFKVYWFYIAAFSFIGAIYLAYLSYFKMRNFCVICTAIYIINLILVILTYINAY
jgi:vitamin-K-epoxide reductase (warfarin-sensitive)